MRSLTPQRWNQIDALFEAALERPPEERDTFLGERCGDDVELRREVEWLLQSYDEAEDALGESVSQFAEPLVEDLRATLDREELEALPGEGRIGPYRLLRVLGRGGMGTVYLAERADEQFEKRVALKLVKRGMDTDEVLQRFRYERQILAALEHPNIGRLYDGGAAGDGRPYLVMEHIDGEPVTTYCDERCLSIDARLQLFETICAAIQFAHRNLVIHRDLKPSNILVTADGTVKLLDFGIAKLLDPSRPELAPRTRTELRLLTPEYASPEQIEGAPVTTATDVYSLGILLFELLTGRRPSHRQGRRTQDRLGLDTGRGRPSSTVVRPILAEDERHPTIAAEEVAARRGTTPERLRTRLRGDLDTITLKALAEEPERRYLSAEQLLADLQRYRSGLPVVARGESIAYRTAKFVRRHRVVVSMSAALVLLLSGFAGTTFMQNRLLRAARTEAEARRGQAEELIGYMLGDLRAKLDPIARLDLLDDVAARASQYFAAVPADQLSEEELLRRAQHLRLLGDVQRRRGNLEAALGTFQDAHAVSADLLHRDSSNAEWRLALATDHFWLGYISHERGDFQGALEHFQEYRRHVQRLFDSDPDNRLYRLELSYAHSNIGSALERMGDRRALQEYNISLQLKESLARLDPENQEYRSALATAYNKLAVAEQRWGNLSSAVEHFRAELAVRESIVARDANDRHAQRLLSLAHNFLGEALSAIGDGDGGLEHRLAAWAIQRELASWDPENAEWQRGLAVSARLGGIGLMESGRAEEGLAALDDSRDILLRLVEREPSSVVYRQELAKTEAALAGVQVRDHPEAALEAATRALAVLEPFQGRADAGARTIEAGAYLDLGRAYAALGREAEAREAWTRAISVVEGNEGDEGLDRLATLARALMHLGLKERAEPVVASLLDRGYRQPEFVALASHNGLLSSQNP